MASGFGVNGSTGRCYPAWMDFAECYSKTDDPVKCNDFRDDYLECLHHKKEFMRKNAIARERKRQLAAGIDVLAPEKDAPKEDKSKK